MWSAFSSVCVGLSAGPVLIDQCLYRCQVQPTCHFPRLTGVYYTSAGPDNHSWPLLWQSHRFYFGPIVHLALCDWTYGQSWAWLSRVKTWITAVGAEALHALCSKINPATAVRRMKPTSHGCIFIMIKLKFSVISVLHYAQNGTF